MKESIIQQATAILREGGLVAFPTETVYGLGADARNPQALLKIFAAKGRPVDHPLIVHLSEISQLHEWAEGISEEALTLAEAFWPGPLTLILRKKPHVSDIVTGGQETIGLRIPSHPIALALLNAVGGGIAAPSANKFGRISPTTAEAVREELGEEVDLIVDGGACEVGVESTIVDVSHEKIVILRPGMITQHEIETVLGRALDKKEKSIPRVSGSLESHYAPRTKTLLIDSEKINDFVAALSEENLPAVVLARNTITKQKNIDIITMPQDAQQYAHDFYQTLRAVDKQQFRLIVIEAVPDLQEWAAVQDRLMRASVPLL